MKRIILIMSVTFISIFTLVTSGCDGSKVDENVTEYNDLIANEETKIEGDFLYSIKNSEVTVIEYIGKGGTVEIPSEINGYPVKSISNGGMLDDMGFGCPFDREKVIDKLIIPEGVVSIGDYAFNADSFVEIILPSTLTNIGIGAFSSTSIESIDIPENLKKISVNAFIGCSNLKYLVVPGNIEIVDDNAFAQCINLKEVIIGEGVKEINCSAFSECINLKSVSLPDTLEKIGSLAFNFCALDSITIPKNVETIGEMAFLDCSNLNEVLYEGEVDFIAPKAFERTPYDMANK